MSTIVRDNENENRYEIVVDDRVAGFVTYEIDDGRITTPHTEVDDAYAGQGLGKQLVTGVLADVEERGLGLVPTCPYVQKVISDDAERYLHLVPEDIQASMGLSQKT